MAYRKPNLRHKVAIVTGGGSGINSCFVKLLVEAGCDVLVADLSLHSEMRKWVISQEGMPLEQYGDRTKGRVEFIKTDVTDWSQLERTFNECNAQFGQYPSIVVPGAGVYEPSSNTFWDDCDENSRYKVLDINLVHPIKMSRLAIKYMFAANKGSTSADIHGTILHVSSIAGQRSSLITPLYQASKHGINSFVRGMAPLQKAAGIRVVAVAPGAVATPLFTEHPEAAIFLDLEQDFMLPPEEIARAMMALLVQLDKYKPGTILEVCDTDERWREASLLNDSGPEGPASKTSRKGHAAEEVWKILGIDNNMDKSQRIAKTD